MVQHENVLTKEDVKSALEAYDKEYYNFTISDIRALTDVHIEKNKRNGRTQANHVKYMNNQRAFKRDWGVYRWRPPGREWDCTKEGFCLAPASSGRNAERMYRGNRD